MHILRPDQEEVITSFEKTGSLGLAMIEQQKKRKELEEKKDEKIKRYCCY